MSFVLSARKMFSPSLFLGFFVIPPEVCVWDRRLLQGGSPASHSPALHSRESLTRANGPKAVSTPELPGPHGYPSQAPPAALLHGQMDSPALSEQLCSCGQPLSQILSLFHSWLHKVDLSPVISHQNQRHLRHRMKFKLKPEQGHTTLPCFWTASPLCWTAWAAAGRTWLFQMSMHPSSAEQTAGEDWPCGHHQQISAVAPFTQTIPLRG